MTVPDLVHRNPVRLSSVSCVTEDSIDSTTIATPLDASPPPPPSNTFSIINIVNDDPLPNPKAYPAIAATYTRRRRAQTSPRPVPSSIIISNTIPQEQPVMIYDTSTSDSQVSNSTIPSTKSSKFWPRIKRMMMPTNNNNNNNNTDKMKQLFESMNISNNDEKSETKLQEQKSNKRWLGKNRARVGPQR
ncbi:hypothetical protein BDF21DRAFT_434232 [Thamnidium elegans]|uniref:Uncharacterized protein n=1 Tax=Thamnidium elegans TaxID=101142 RepID=A0A8H7ST24_9FUNG|nr:hypothetical protein INT48_003404 [Thamnidium elegans]KAI8047505.1 hypothetical protein BDF21DRAFT_434232 [Thamnidium elegans]